MKRNLLILVLALGLTSCSAPSAHSAVAEPEASVSGPPAPPAPREFRAAWIATVGNINWPSKPGLPVDEQKREALDLIDRCAALNLNAIVLQVRPCADAFYPSELEPWSEYLTGVQGRPPSPMYDPMQFWVDECHKHGIELHAWFNPYRVKSGDKSPLAATSIAKTQPEIVKKYGQYLWMDPGEPASAQHTLKVILDIVRRYDIDGVHTDDYYYPYKIKDKDGVVNFPDEQSYQKYKTAGGKLTRDDWRRENINQLVQRIYTETKRIKPYVKVSYAPFGIWKNGIPQGTKGLSQYDELYSDPKLWLNKGWLDFLSPQLYWKIGGDQDFVALLNWWLSENTQKRFIWPGMSVGRYGSEEVINQIKVTRKSPLSDGQVLWSAGSVIGQREKAQQINASLRAGPYAEKALVPAFTWLDRHPPSSPAASVKREGNRAVIRFQVPRGEPAFIYGVWARYGSQWHFTSVPGGAPMLSLNADAQGQVANAVTISAVDRCGNESERLNLPVR